MMDFHTPREASGFGSATRVSQTPTIPPRCRSPPRTSARKDPTIARRAVRAAAASPGFPWAGPQVFSCRTLLRRGGGASPWYVDVDSVLTLHSVANEVLERAVAPWLPVSIRFNTEPDTGRDTSRVLPRVVFPVPASRLAATVQTRTRVRRRVVLYPAAPPADPAGSRGRRVPGLPQGAPVPHSTQLRDASGIAHQQLHHDAQQRRTEHPGRRRRGGALDRVSQVREAHGHVPLRRDGKGLRRLGGVHHLPRGVRGRRPDGEAGVPVQVPPPVHIGVVREPPRAVSRPSA